VFGQWGGWTSKRSGGPKNHHLARMRKEKRKLNMEGFQVKIEKRRREKEKNGKIREGCL